MKKLLLVLFLLPVTLSAQNVNILDINFKNALLSTSGSSFGYVAKNAQGNQVAVDANSDGEIQVAEAAAIFELYLSPPNTSYPNITNLTGINGFINLKILYCSENDINVINVSGLSNLEELYCNDNSITTLNLSGLGNLRILDCKINNITNLTVEGCVNLEQLICLGNSLTSLGLTSLQNLEVLDVSSNDFTALDLTALTALTSVNCSNNSLTSLIVAGLTNLTEIECSNNELSSLDLQGLTNLTTLRVLENQLTTIDLSMLTALQSLFCSFNTLDSLNLTQNANLTTLYCSYNNLTTLDVSANAGLTVIDCSGNQLTSLDVSSCTQLFELNAIYNGLEYLNIKNGYTYNYNLYVAFNDLQYVCADGPEVSQVTGIIVNLYPGCIVNSYCSFVPGGAFYDITASAALNNPDNDCNFEPAIPLAGFMVSNGDTYTIITADSSGSASLPVQSGTHTLTPILSNPNYYVATPQEISLSLPSETEDYTYNFCLDPIGTFHDLAVSLLPTTAARPGFDSSYRLTYKNNGTTPLSGSVAFTYLEDVVDFSAATITPDTFAEGILTWSFDNLQPFQEVVIDVTLNVNSPMDIPAVNIDDQLDFSVIGTITAEESTPPNNQYGFKQVVVGSYDPNDKTCLEGKSISVEQVGDYVQYVIRFENTGNYVAENIVVKDVINTSRFQIASLMPYQSSHPFITRVVDGNTVEFVFEDIMLEGLPSDDRHGFIAFKIKTVETLVANNIFTNNAEIYFDYNFPVITNTTQTIVKGELGLSHRESSSPMFIYPNPAGDSITITMANDFSLKSITLFNMLGQIIYNAPFEGNIVDVSNLPTGTYILEAVSEHGNYRTNFVKQ